MGVALDPLIWLLDVPSGIVGVSGGMIFSPSVLANGDGGTDDACGRCAFLGAWGGAASAAKTPEPGDDDSADPSEI